MVKGGMPAGSMTNATIVIARLDRAIHATAEGWSRHRHFCFVMAWMAASLPNRGAAMTEQQLRSRSRPDHGLDSRWSLSSGRPTAGPRGRE
jgi:hypothetical protein